MKTNEDVYHSVHYKPQDLFIDLHDLLLTEAYKDYAWVALIHDRIWRRERRTQIILDITNHETYSK